MRKVAGVPPGRYSHGYYWVPYLEGAGGDLLVQLDNLDALADAHTQSENALRIAEMRIDKLIRTHWTEQEIERAKRAEEEDRQRRYR